MDNDAPVRIFGLPMAETTHTLSEENYLKAIFMLSEGGSGRIPTSAVAAALGVNAASVTDKLQKLGAKGFLDYEKSRGVTLTKKGKDIALRVVRKHRIWETFLVKFLDFGWDEVHEIAEQLEHIQSDLLIERIEKHLGYPRFDPHGEPIPDAKGRVSKPCFKPLDGLGENSNCRITGVAVDNVAFLKLFKKLGLSIGDRLEVREKEEYDQSLIVKVNGKKQIRIGKDVAQNILVTLNEKCCVFEDNQMECLGK